MFQANSSAATAAMPSSAGRAQAGWSAGDLHNSHRRRRRRCRAGVNAVGLSGSVSTADKAVPPGIPGWRGQDMRHRAGQAGSEPPRRVRRNLAGEDQGGLGAALRATFENGTFLESCFRPLPNWHPGIWPPAQARPWLGDLSGGPLRDPPSRGVWGELGGSLPRLGVGRTEACRAGDGMGAIRSARAL